MSRTESTHQNLATWLLTKETIGDGDPAGLADALERVGQKLSRRLGKSVSEAGARALVARALYVARREFRFLDGVSVGTTAERCFEGLSERLQAVDPEEARMGLEAVLAIVLDLLAEFVGEDLTLRLVRDVWPDLPFFELSRSGQSDGLEVAS